MVWSLVRTLSTGLFTLRAVKGGEVEGEGEGVGVGEGGGEVGGECGEVVEAIEISCGFSSTALPCWGEEAGVCCCEGEHGDAALISMF